MTRRDPRGNIASVGAWQRLVAVVGIGAGVLLAQVGCGGSVGSTRGGDSGNPEAASPSSSGSGSGSSSGIISGSSSGSSSGGDSGTGAPPSCRAGGPGLTNCGAASESCCASAEVPGGTYYRTYDPVDPSDQMATLAADGGPTGEADPATVSSFRLDKYDVTVGRFRQFVSSWSGGWTPGAGSGKHSHLNGGRGLVDVGASPDAGTVYETGWVTTDDSNIAPTNANVACDPAYQTWTNTASTQENLPINCVNWYEAYAFCIWDGGFLPSEAEWEYAAAGGNQQREYPWGSSDPGTSNSYAIYGGGGRGQCYYPGPGSQSCTGVLNIAPVGTAASGSGLWGELDLAGDMWQWNMDWWESPYTACSDCADLTASATCAAPPCSPAGPSFRVFRGGAFNYGVASLLPAGRNGNPPAERNYTLGFRCARVP